MQSFSYTKTSMLIKSLTKIDHLRQRILLAPISPADELKLQWESLLSRIHFTLALQGILVSQENISMSLSSPGSQTPHPHASLMEGYKRVFDFLYHNWLVNKNVISPDDLQQFYKTYCGGSFTCNKEELAANLTYVQINPEHPVIQASLAQLFILTNIPLSQKSEQFSHLVFYMFLYKNGYDVRRLPVYEEYYYANLISYKNMLTRLGGLANVTPWLEYSAIAVISSLEKTLLAFSQQNTKDPQKETIFDLGERQKLIMNLLVQPGIKLTNKMVQRSFDVSQITASRDLAKLVHAGLIVSRGKGRSTYYTKI